MKPPFTSFSDYTYHSALLFKRAVSYVEDVFGQSVYDLLVQKFLNASKAYLDSFNLSEWHLYGSSRIGIYQTSQTLVSLKFYADTSAYGLSNLQPVQVYYASMSYDFFFQERGKRHYELTNHLGNVLTVISDKRMLVCNADTVTYSYASIISATDYSPFGAPLAGRTFSSESYRFRFNGKENDKEINGSGNAIDFGARIYDSRLGRWFALDQLFPMYCGISGYNFVHNNPIRNLDIKGLFVLPANMPEKEREFALKIINSAAELLKDPYVLREFMLHSGLTKSQIEMIFTNGYGPMVEFSCPTDVDHIAEMQVNGSTSFDEMALDKYYSIQDYIKQDKIIFNKDVFIEKGNKLDLTSLSNPNIPPHHSFFLGVVLLHELVHFGDARSDGVQYKQYNYSMLYELTNNGENIGEQMIINMQDITKNAGYKNEIKKFPLGIEIGKGFEYMTFGWSIDYAYSKDRYEEYIKDRENRNKNGNVSDSKENKSIKSPRSM